MEVKGWWFGTIDRKLGYGDERKIVIGETHTVDGEIIPCNRGLHLSKRIIDALNYAPGPVVYRVVGSGVVVPHGDPVDKYACSERTYISGGVDISDTLSLFARKCALDVIHLWDAPDVVIRYLKTGDMRIVDAAWEAAWAAARAAAMDAARDAAVAAGNAAMAAMAAWDAEMAALDAANSAAKAALWAKSSEEGWISVRAKINKRLSSMVSCRLKTWQE